MNKIAEQNVGPPYKSRCCLLNDIPVSTGQILWNKCAVSMLEETQGFEISIMFAMDQCCFMSLLIFRQCSAEVSQIRYATEWNNIVINEADKIKMQSSMPG